MYERFDDDSDKVELYNIMEDNLDKDINFYS